MMLAMAALFATLMADVVAHQPSVNELQQARMQDVNVLESASNALSKMRAYVQEIGDENETDVQSLAESAEKAGAKKTKGEMEAAEDTFEKRLAALSEGVAENATNATLIAKLVAAADKAADGVDEVGHRTAKSMHKAYSEMRSHKKNQARHIGGEAKSAAYASLKTARKVEGAERHASLSEKEFEGDFMRNEKLSEGMELHAEKLRDEAEKQIDKLFSYVEDEVDRRGDEIEKKAKDNAKALRGSVLKLSVEAKKARKAAAAKKAAQEAVAKEVAAKEKAEEKAADEKKAEEKKPDGEAQKTDTKDDATAEPKKTDGEDDQQKDDASKPEAQKTDQKDEEKDTTPKAEVRQTHEKDDQQDKKQDAPAKDATVELAAVDPVRLALEPGVNPMFGLAVLLAFGGGTLVWGRIRPASARTFRDAPPLLG
mmetsp:Transcript_61494/g.173665  ORF Transcript_61494/g.173665 Transcript_61494/m.173665 type:complete len:427 (-) Transcript_61494:287-1567(-)